MPCVNGLQDYSKKQCLSFLFFANASGDITISDYIYRIANDLQCTQKLHVNMSITFYTHGISYQISENKYGMGIKMANGTGSYRLSLCPCPFSPVVFFERASFSLLLQYLNLRSTSVKDQVPHENRCARKHLLLQHCIVSKSEM